jgi:hypothetical protein
MAEKPAFAEESLRAQCWRVSVRHQDRVNASSGVALKQKDNKQSVGGRVARYLQYVTYFLHSFSHHSARTGRYCRLISTAYHSWLLRNLLGRQGVFEDQFRKFRRQIRADGN